MASLYERSNGTYYANFYENGNRARISLETKEKREALRKLDELEAAHERGDFDPFADKSSSGNPDSPTSVSEVIEQFTEEKENQGRSESTVHTYRSVWRRFSESIAPKTKLEEINAADIHDFIHDSSVSPSTCHKRWRHVRAVLRWAESEVVKQVNPPQRPDKLPTPVRERELEALIAALKEDYRQKRRKRSCRPGQLIWAIPVFRFTFYTGLRASEIGRLKWKHLDLDRGLILIKQQKNNREQTVPLISPAREALHDTPTPRSSNYYVFRTPAGSPRERNVEAFGRQCSRRFKEARNLTDMGKKTFHDLRAGFATALADAGMSAHQIREAMRHSNLSTALKYVKASRKKLRSDMEDAF